VTPQIRSRWQSNLTAAGIHADDETLERVAPGVAERLDGLREALGRLDYRHENPDYLRDNADEEQPGGDV
jgi:hypothetical protein